MRSADGGGNWTGINTGLPNTLAACIAINASGDLFVGLMGDAGIHRSTDNGESWESANNGLPPGTVSSVAIDRSDNVFIGIVGLGLFKSTDNGESWEGLDVKGSGDCIGDYIAVSPTGDIYGVCGRKSVFRSTDGSESWTCATDSFTCPPSNTPVYPYRLRFSGAGTVYALVLNPSCQWFSTDDGKTWEMLQTEAIDDQITDLCCKPGGMLNICTSNEGVYRSLDNGASWNQINTGLWNKHVFIMRADGQGDIYTGVSEGGIYRYRESEDVWRQVNDVMPTGARCIFITSRGTALAGTMGNIFRSTDRGVSWRPANEGIGGYATCFAENEEGEIFTGTHLNGVYRSDDDGLSWTSVKESIEDAYLRTITVDPEGNLFAGGWECGVFRSTDNGQTWLKINEGLDDLDVTSLVVSGSGAVFAGTFESGVFRLDDQADAWHPFNNGLADLTIRAMAFLPQHSLCAGTDDGIYVSLDKYNNWHSLHDERPTLCPRSLAVNGEGDLYVAAHCSGSISGGIFRWNIAYKEWEKIDEALPEYRAYVYEIEFDREGYCFAATSIGVYRTVESTHYKHP